VKTAGWKRLSRCCCDLYSVEISNSAVITCSSQSYVQVVNKSNSPIHTPSTVVHENVTLYKTLVGKPEENRPIGRPRRGWEDDIKMDLRERWD
jgi:hypothetical protein